MIIETSGTVLVTKVDGNNNFFEDSLSCDDIPLTTTGLDYSRLNIVGPDLQSGLDQLIFKTSDQLYRSNYVLVKDLDDFPTPIDGVITLASGCFYEINGTVDLQNNTLVVNHSNALWGRNHLVDHLYYSGSGIMLSCNLGSLQLKELKIDTPISGSLAISFSGTAISGHHIHMDQVHFGDVGCFEVGRILGGEVLEFKNCSYTTNVGRGWTISGEVNEVLMQANRFGSMTSGFTAITVQSGNYDVLMFNNNYFHSYPSQTIFNIPNITTLSGGYIQNNIISTFNGGGTKLTGGLLNTNIYWYIKNNEGLDGFRRLGFIKFSGNTIPTVISNTTTYYVASGINDPASVGERFDVSVNNRIKYIGRETVDANIILTGSVACTSANETLRIAVYRYSSLEDSFTMVGEVEVRVPAAKQSVNLSMNDIVTLDTNDYLEVRVRNLTDTTNIILEYMQFRVGVD